MAVINSILLESIEKFYAPHQFVLTEIINLPESQKYGACSFKLNDKFNIQFREAHITPKKAGQFVTLWKRTDKGPIQPYELFDPIDFFVITVKNQYHFGQFIFPRKVLFENGILAFQGKGGKRALRVYAPWDETQSLQAKKTQAWQSNYFLDMSLHKPINTEQVKKLYSI